jgi:two-component system, cell cycle sensor histidine kinase and response regulator CckA
MSELNLDKNRRILIIDDNRAIHDDFRKILSPGSGTTAELYATETELFGKSAKVPQKIRYEIDSAYQGHDGVLLVQQALEAGRPYAMAFVDIRMPPGMDGVETTRKIWEIDPEIQIVLCTAYADYSWDDMFQKIGNCDGLLILKKPFDTVEALQLAHALTEKWWLHRQSRQKMEELESMVGKRTSELRQTNEALEIEIAEHERAEKTLRESDEKFHQLADNITDVFWIRSPDMREVHYVSPAFERIWGRSAASLQAGPQQWTDFILPEDRERVLVAFAALRGDARSLEIEYRIVRPDGEIRWVRVRGFQVRDALDNLIRHTGIVTDITERKRVEDELRESEERFSGAFEHAPIGMSLVSPDGRFLKVNRALCDVVGYSEAELLTRTFQDITHPEDLAADLENVRGMLAGEIRAYQMEKRYVHARGHLIVVLLNVSLVRDGQGQPRYFISQIQDISGRRQAEESLRLLSSAVEQSNESIVITDAELDLPGPKIVFVNPGYTKMTGYTAAEAIGKTPRILQGPHTDRAVLDRLRQNLERGEVFQGQTVNYRKDGKEFNLEWQITPLRNTGGIVTHFVAIQRDITARKRFEAQMFQSQKMETVGKLAGGIAHEFNSILTAIIGQSELLLADLPAGSPLTNNAVEISKAAGRAATLTRQLLAYGRKQFLQLETLDLNQVLATMEGMFQHLMGGDVDMQIVPAPDLQAVRVDAGQMEQVIMNLVINARDAMPKGGKLTLETANVSFDPDCLGRSPEFQPGDYVMLAITDTGAGMSAEVKAHVFEPFFTTKDVGQGPGLGLATCYGIIKQSGGHISVYSELGRGTTFKIYLPQVESQTKPPIQRLDAPDLPRGTETILLVEDDPALREMAATLLRRLGYTILTAANGIEALSLKQRPGIGQIDLLFTDVVMPHMSGRELADRVQALYPRTRILFTSAYTENAIAHQGMLDRGVALLQKPFTPSALSRRLRDVLDKPVALKPDPAQRS